MDTRGGNWDNPADDTHHNHWTPNQTPQTHHFTRLASAHLWQNPAPLTSENSHSKLIPGPTCPDAAGNDRARHAALCLNQWDLPSMNRGATSAKPRNATPEAFWSKHPISPASPKVLRTDAFLGLAARLACGLQISEKSTQTICETTQCASKGRRKERAVPDCASLAPLLSTKYNETGLEQTHYALWEPSSRFDLFHPMQKTPNVSICCAHSQGTSLLTLEVVRAGGSSQRRLSFVAYPDSLGRK